MTLIHFRPKLLDTLDGYRRADFGADFSSGLTVGVLALPLAMAFAIASGMSPAAGIWTAIVAGLLVSVLGGSRVQIAGPTGAFIPILYAIVVDYGVQNLLIATMMSGVLLLAMGAFRLGTLIRFIPIAVVVGFTNGIAVVIFLSQIKDFLGLQIAHLPGEFFALMHTLATQLHTLDGPTTLFALASLLILLGWNRLADLHFSWMRRFPGPLAVLVIATVCNAMLDLPIETIGSRFGGIPQDIPSLTLPTLSLGTLGKLITPAITIALLGAIESLLSARVADSIIDDRHDPNQELMAQGIANIAAPLFGGFAATGAIARTATIARTGGRTPVAGIIHSAVLLAIVLALAPLASDIPLATLSAIVVVVAVNMGEWRAFSPRYLSRYSLAYSTILIGTFIVTVVFDLTLAVQIGLLMSSLYFIYHIADLTRIERIALPETDATQRLWLRDDGSPRVLAYRVYGSLFFGAANKLENLLKMPHGCPNVLILDLAKVIHIDSTGLDALQTLQRNLGKRGAELVLCELNPQPAAAISRSGFLEQLGEHNVAASLSSALEQAKCRGEQRDQALSSS